jgi:hypothetical protein
MEFFKAFDIEENIWTRIFYNLFQLLMKIIYH